MLFDNNIKFGSNANSLIESSNEINFNYKIYKLII